MELDLEHLAALTARPALGQPGEPLFWDDPHISRQMLEAHLNPDIDAASRRPAAIERSVEWLMAALRLAPGMRLLDLGCGPGLYAERFARRGLRVTGIDYSRRSIDYAREQARLQGLDIEYVYQDYLTLDRGAEFDAAVLIYCDFGVLTPADRDILLSRVRGALRPGGRFAFDVFTGHKLGPTTVGPGGAPGAAEEHEVQRWEICRSGFWKDEPYLCLEQRFYYPEGPAYLDQYVVIGQTGAPKVYRVWDYLYSPETITAVLATQSFDVQGIWADLEGTPYRAGSPSLGVVAAPERG